MENPNRSAFLRQVLFTDAICSGACVLALLCLAGPLSALFLLPAGLLVGTGLAFAPFVAFVTWTAWPSDPRPALVWVVIAANIACAIASVALVLSGEVTPNALGYGFIAVQGLFVVAIAELEYVGLRRARDSLRFRREQPA